MDEETRAEVAEEAMHETETEQTEQRTDDYDGLARRMDDALAEIRAIKEQLDRIEGLYSTFVDAGAIVTGASDTVAAAAAEGVLDAIEDILDLEQLDYSL